jgi:hypothetical protein
MGPGYFVIAILGCADGGGSCTPVTTLHTRYESAQQCSEATAAALEANNDFDFPTLVASCRPSTLRSSAPKRQLHAIPASVPRD